MLSDWISCLDDMTVAQWYNFYNDCNTRSKERCERFRFLEQRKMTATWWTLQLLIQELKMLDNSEYFSKLNIQ